VGIPVLETWGAEMIGHDAIIFIQALADTRKVWRAVESSRDDILYALSSAEERHCPKLASLP